MVREAQEHQEEDKARRSAVEARNQLDGLVYSTENSLKEYGSSLDPTDRSEIEKAIAQAKKKLEDSSITADALRAESQSLSDVSHKLAKKMYESAAAQKQGTSASEASSGAQSSSKQGGDDVVDADFEEVK